MPKEVKRIESADNDLFKLWSRLNESSGIKKSGLYLLGGPKLVGEALSLHPEWVDTLIVKDLNEVPAKLPEKVRPVHLHPRLFDQINALGTPGPLLTLKYPALQSWPRETEPRGLELFLALQDPGNLGSAIRSAVAFGVTKIVLLKEAANPYLPKAVKAAAGALLKANMETGPSILELSPSDRIYVLDPNGSDLNDFDWPKNLRLLIGEEGRGIPNNLVQKNLSLRIETSEQVESLNASSALSIALYSFRQKN